MVLEMKLELRYVRIIANENWNNTTTVINYIRRLPMAMYVCICVMSLAYQSKFN